MTTTFALVGGGLPPGLTLNPDGSITGTPTSATGGSYDFVVAATNSAGTTTALYRLPYLTLPTWNTYGGLLINWYPSDPTAATVQSLSVVATSTSGFPIAYVLSSGNLPPGCTIDESSGIISGVVGGGPNNAATTYTFGIAAYDSGFNNMVTRSFSIHVLAAPRPTATAKWTGPAYSNVFSGNKTIWAGAEIDWTLTGSMLGSDAILSAYTLTTTVDPAFPLISGLDLSNDGPVATISGNIDPSLPTGTYTTHYLVSNPFIMFTYISSVLIHAAQTPVWGPDYVSDLSASVKADGTLNLIPTTSGGRSLAAISIYAQGMFAPVSSMIVAVSPVLNPVLTISSGALPPGLTLSFFAGDFDQTDWLITGRVPSTARGQAYFFTITAYYCVSSLTIPAATSYAWDSTSITGRFANAGPVMGSSSADFFFAL